MKTTLHHGLGGHKNRLFDDLFGQKETDEGESRGDLIDGQKPVGGIERQSFNFEFLENIVGGETAGG